mgnify:CR=1 FL=1
MRITRRQWEVLTSLEKRIVLLFLHYALIKCLILPTKIYRKLFDRALIHLCSTFLILGFFPPPSAHPTYAILITWLFSVITLVVIFFINTSRR